MQLFSCYNMSQLKDETHHKCNIIKVLSNNNSTPSFQFYIKQSCVFVVVLVLVDSN